MESIMSYYLSVGSYSKPPHFSVVGHPTYFYLWVNTDGRGQSSAWLKGASAFSEYNKLKNLLDKKDRDGFVSLVKLLHAANPRDSL